MNMQNWTGSLSLSLATLLVVDVAAAAGHGKGITKSRFVKGVAVTGFNQKLGEPIWDFGELGIPMITTSYAYNPDGDEPDELTRDTPRNTLVATGADAGFYDSIGLVPDEKFINVPLREIPIIVNGGGVREKLESVLETSPSESSLSLPNYPITLGSWLNVRSTSKVKCYRNGTSKISFHFKGLIPNGIYTVWGIFGIDSNNDGAQDSIVANALGGVPNVVVPNTNGVAKTSRKLNFCPLDKASGLRVVDIAFHADGNVFGSSIDLGIPGFPGLLAAPTQVAFPFDVTPIR